MLRIKSLSRLLNSTKMGGGFKKTNEQGLVFAGDGYVRAKEKGSQLFGYPLCHHPSGKSE